MTTVFVSKRLGLAMTDSRATNTHPRFFLGFFQLTPKTTRTVVPQKALYIHDRLFLACGNVSTITLIMRYLTEHKMPDIPKDCPSCECLLLGKEYAIHMYIDKGKFHKKTLYLKPDFCFIMGSGYDHLFWVKGHKYLPYFSPDFVIDAFRNVCTKDKYTDDNINLYGF